jgi:hypothetical protein
MLPRYALLLVCFTAAATIAAASRPVMQRPKLDETTPPPQRRAATTDITSAYEFVLANPACHAPIRDQGQCGSCWAFAAADSLSDRVCVRSGKVTPLSPQDMLNCELLNLGCTLGSLPGAAWKFLEKKGVATEACVPYRSFDPRKEKCDKTCPGESGGSMKNVTKATNVTHLTTEADMMGAIAEGPIGMLLVFAMLCAVLAEAVLTPGVNA